MYYKKVFLLILFVFTFASCSKTTKETRINNEFVTIGTFNIAWLGDGIDDNMMRSDEESKLVAETIKETGFEIIGLQEIENIAALAKLTKYLPGYKYFVSESGGKQNLAVLYRDYINLEYVKDYMPIAVEENRTRPGMFLKARKGNFDFYMMVVHFKSTSRFDDTPEKRTASFEMRTRQSEVLSNWIDSVLANGKEQDLILVGDFNDFPLRDKNPTLTPLLANSNISFLTRELTSCKNEKWYVIDHIVVSNSAKTRLVENSLTMENFRNRLPKEVADKVSDHCPIGVAFEIVSPDND